MFGENTPMRAVAIVTLFVHNFLMKEYSQPSHLIYTIHKLDSSFFHRKTTLQYKCCNQTGGFSVLATCRGYGLTDIITRI